MRDDDHGRFGDGHEFSDDGEGELGDTVEVIEGCWFEVEFREDFVGDTYVAGEVRDVFEVVSGLEQVEVSFDGVSGGHGGESDGGHTVTCSGLEYGLDVEILNELFDFEVEEGIPVEWFASVHRFLSRLGSISRIVQGWSRCDLLGPILVRWGCIHHLRALFVGL